MKWFLGIISILFLIFIWGGLIVSHYIENDRIAKNNGTNRKEMFWITTKEVGFTFLILAVATIVIAIFSTGLSHLNF